MPKKQKDNFYSQPEFVTASADEENSISVERVRRGSTKVGSFNTLDKRFPHIGELPDPFSYNGDYVDINDVILMVEKAYFHFPLFQNVVETLVELTNSEVILKKSNKTTRLFFQKWFEKINLSGLKEQWFRSFYLNHNVYAYRFDASLSDDALNTMMKVFGDKLSEKSSVKLPIRYIMLNPSKIATANGFYYQNKFYQILTFKDLERIRYPKTDEDEMFRSSFTKAQLKEIDSSTLRIFYLELNEDKIYYSARKKQDYWPYGIPFGYGVLQDIDYKLMLKKLDREVAKTFDLALLLVTCGESPANGGAGINYKNLEVLKNLFKNSKIQRTLIADWTTKIEWKIPDISKLLGPEKYKEVNDDLKRGLFSAIFEEGDKFASMSIKLKTFVDKLVEARDAFINDFLLPEIKRVSKEMGFKNYPIPEFLTIDLEDTPTLRKIYMRMAELGFLTPTQIEDAINKGILPQEDEMIEAQQKFKQWKKDDLFEPQLNRKAEDAGRPAGTAAPKTSNKVGKIGAKASISFKNLTDKVIQFASLEDAIRTKIGDKFKDNPNLDSLVFSTAQAISLTEKDKNWAKSIASYIKNPKPISEEVKQKISQIEEEFDVSDKEATLIYLSRNE